MCVPQTGGKLSVHTLHHAGGETVAALLPSAARADTPPFHLVAQPLGSLTHLKPQLLATTMAELQPHEALLRVSAVGLNFRDVLNVLDMYPGDPGPPGGDCAGTVLAVGAGVSHLAPGVNRFLLPYHDRGSTDVRGTPRSCSDTLAALLGWVTAASVCKL